MLSHIVPEERRGEAMGYYGSAMTAGAAMGAPIAGVFIDLISPEAGYIFAAGVALLMVAAAYVVRAFRRRGRARV